MKSLSQKKYELPDPGNITNTERGEAANSYLMMLASWLFGLPLPFVGLIAAIIYYVNHKGTTRFVAFHSLQALTALAIVSIINAGVIFWLLFLFLNSFENLNSFLVFAVFSVILNILYLVFSFLAGLKARKGHYYFFILPASIATTRFSSEEIQIKEQVEIDLPEDESYRMN